MFWHLSRGLPSPDNLLHYQSQKLRRLVQHAYERVPYYRRLFDQHRLRPQDISGVEELSMIPITSRRDLQSLPVNQVVARAIDPEKLQLHRTSGSSGEPFTVRRSLAEDRFLYAQRLRAFHQLGWRHTDRWANVALIRPADGGSPFGVVSSILRRVGSFRPRGFNCILPLQELITALRQYQPDVLTGYPGVLARLALLLTDDDRRFIRPRIVVTESEVLAPLMREHIRKGFGAPTYEFYASWEFNLLAWECPATGELHTCDDGVILEVLADGRPVPEGDRGEVVATNLHSFAMPLIRYRLGDVVTKGRSSCACGRPFATIRAVQGRMVDYFSLPDGRLVHPYEISQFVVHGATPWVRQYQLTQERTDHIVLRVVPMTRPSSEAVASLRQPIDRLLGPGVTLDLVIVSEIPPEPSGKFRVARSLVHSMYDEDATG